MHRNCFHDIKFPVVSLEQKWFFVLSEYWRPPAGARASSCGVMWREGLYCRVKKAAEYKWSATPLRSPPHPAAYLIPSHNMRARIDLWQFRDIILFDNCR
jgi:hypothetical protein